LANTKTTRKLDKVFTFGKMGELIMETGTMESSMEMDIILFQITKVRVRFQ
jgi:hypothetical protein